MAMKNVEAGARLNLQNYQGQTAIFQAVEKKKNNCVDILLRAGANVNIRDRQGETVLYKVIRGNYEYIATLLKAGADVNNTNNFGLTALMIAIFNHNPGCIFDLLEAGADMNIADNEGWTALHAVMHSLTFFEPDKIFINIIKTLLDAGAEVNTLTADGKSVTSLYCKATRQEKGTQKQILMLLFAAGEKSVEYKERTKDKLSLSGLCRKRVRKYLLKLDRHENLFIRIPRLEIPITLHDYLLYEQTLDWELE